MVLSFRKLYTVYPIWRDIRWRSRFSNFIRLFQIVKQFKQLRIEIVEWRRRFDVSDLNNDDSVETLQA